MAKKDTTVEDALRLFKKDKQAWGDIYKKALEDLDFLSDDDDAQWSAGDYQERKKTGRPALTIDKLGQFTRQVVNQIRMNTPSINVIPSDGAGSTETAEVMKGLIRNIEYCSNADAAYDMSALSSVRCGLGFIRVDHDYEGDTFDQELKVKRVVNTLNCWIDSDSIEIDGSDAKHAFIADQITVGEFKKQFPKFEVSSFETGTEDEKEYEDEDYITIVEYFKVMESDKEIATYDDVDGITDYDPNREDETNRRTIKQRTVKRCKLSGKDVLEETTFAGEFIPLVPVYGEEFWRKGKRHLFSLVRKAKTAQQMHNYWKSLETEVLMKQPQAPIMAAEGQTEEYAEDWKNPSKTAVLRWKSVDSEGNPIPPPQRLSPPVTPSGIFQASLGTVDDIKSAMGMYGSSIGQQTNETSGIAIQRRKQEGEVGTFHFADNLVKSIQHVGRILVSAIPTIYDTPRVIRIVGMEDETDMVGINGEVVDKQEEQFDLTQGKYDVRVTTGASFTTQRQESAEFMSQVVTSQPELMQIAGDLVFKYMDVAGAEALSERIKKTIPPELLDDENEEQNPEAMQAQAQLQEAAANIQMMQQELQKMEEQLKSKEGELQVKAMSEQAKAQNDAEKLQLEHMKLQLEQEEAAFEKAVKDRELQLKSEELELKKLEIVGRMEQEQEKMLLDAQTAETPVEVSPDNYVGDYGENEYE